MKPNERQHHCVRGRRPMRKVRHESVFVDHHDLHDDPQRRVKGASVSVRTAGAPTDEETEMNAASMTKNTTRALLVLLLAALAAIAILTPVAHAAGNSAVLELTDDTFDDAIGGSDGVFVKFYATWCGHCKNLAPIYEELGDAFRNKKGIKIAKIDADKYRIVGGRFDVKGFPTLKYFPAGSMTPIDYSAGRDLDSLVAYIEEQSGVKASIVKPISDVHELTDETFYVEVGKDKNYLVEFYAPWCGHCKALAPIYEKVATLFAPESNCVVSKLDGDANRNTSTAYDINGFPTLKFFPANELTPVEYSGQRTEQDIVAFLNEHCGTGRSIGGGFIDTYGVSSDLEAIFSKFLSAEKSARAAIEKEMATAVSKLSADLSYASYYAKVLEKVQKKGIDYVSKELTRLTNILEKSDSVDPVALDSFFVRKNILNSLKKIVDSGSNVREDL